uniref:Chitin-binding type-2 domain-containing protein n=1 Tax=Glossina brevipalpis TaxID=37001 RepID=A0A1A9WFB4_9MUSC
MNKKIIYLGVLLSIFVYTLAAEDCNPESDGKPICSERNNDMRFRNYWDPTKYWSCNDLKAVSNSCQPSKLYDDKLQDCINWYEWVWSNPCPELSAGEIF